MLNERLIMEVKLMGFKRENGSYGIRNYILTISTVHCANHVCQQIASQTNSHVIVHDKGCVENIASHQQTYNSLRQAGIHNNVYGVLLVGLGCEQTDNQALLNDIAKVNRNVHFLSIQETGGVPETVEKGVAIIRQMQSDAALLTREPMSMEQLVLAVQCGGSDWTTAISGNPCLGKLSDIVVSNGGTVLMSEIEGLPGSEATLAKMAENQQTQEQIIKLVNDFRRDYKIRKGNTIEEVNPTYGNKLGGITTLVEKSIGNIKKIGDTTINGIVNIGQAIPKPGVWLVDNRAEGPDTVNLTGLVLAGANIVVFNSGLGSPLGSALVPVIKVTGNSQTYDKMRSMIDFDAGTVLSGTALDQCGQELYAYLVSVVNGENTKSEVNGNSEFTIPYHLEELTCDEIPRCKGGD